MNICDIEIVRHTDYEKGESNWLILFKIGILKFFLELDQSRLFDLLQSLFSRNEKEYFHAPIGDFILSLPVKLKDKFFITAEDLEVRQYNKPQQSTLKLK